ncbi:MAG: glycosyltransferase [Marinilabiliaceae bacterium]|nr:glycosyltransferase [Marinilabiliaceae bacterium]
MHILYIGQYDSGTTSKMRADQLKQILEAENSLPVTFNIIDTHIPFNQSHRLWRSMGFRYKRGPLIKRVNKYIAKKVSILKTQNSRHFDLIWVDKAIFLTPKTTTYLGTLTDKLVHFTPDPAFTFHKSHLFKASLPTYDYAITTKAYELKYFEQYLNKERIMYATQGFDKNLHQPLTAFEAKKKGLLFIGHHEKERETVFQRLIKESIHVSIAGIKWEAFVNKNKNNQYLHYLGKGIYGEDYVKTLSAYQFSWGSVSKWIPELHTTRTFEIPACGTALITECNKETTVFFTDEEAIFYDSVDEIIEKIKYYQTHSIELEALTKKGMERVHTDGRDYESILKKVLDEIGLISQ